MKLKLGKEALLAIIESALFVIGAIFLMLVFIIPSNPIWALVIGILCGLAGAIVWSYPFFVRMSLKIRNSVQHKIKRIQDSTPKAEDYAKAIQGADDPENNRYELHRSDSYDNLTDDIIARSAPTTPTEPKQPTTAKSTSEPKAETKPAN